MDYYSAELSDSLEVSDRRRNMPKSGQKRSESLCAGLFGTVRYILGIVWPSFRLTSGSKSQISGRILKSSPGPFSSAETTLTVS